MKKIIPVFQLLVLALVFVCSCRKEESPVKPVLVSFFISQVTPVSAVCGGEVTSDGGSAVLSRGVCWGTVKHPVVSGNHTSDGEGTGIFTSSITGLSPGKKYYARVYASNSAGISYGIELSFRTLDPEQVTDLDGNIYNEITLGSQTWLTEDLRTTHYNDSTLIPLTRIAADWSVLVTAAYCWYNNDSLSNKDTYGALYNWFAVNTGKLCPEGWHIPTDSEWKTLETYLGMNQEMADADGFRGFDQGIQLRNITGWNELATSSNTSGFAAMPGGFRNSDGSFQGIGNAENWWSSSGNDLNTAWKRGLYYSEYGVFRGIYPKSNGYSVRCLKNK